MTDEMNKKIEAYYDQILDEVIKGKSNAQRELIRNTFLKKVKASVGQSVKELKEVEEKLQADADIEAKVIAEKVEGNQFVQLFMDGLYKEMTNEKLNEAIKTGEKPVKSDEPQVSFHFGEGTVEIEGMTITDEMNEKIDVQMRGIIKEVNSKTKQVLPTKKINVLKTHQEINPEVLQVPSVSAPVMPVKPAKNKTLSSKKNEKTEPGNPTQHKENTFTSAMRAFESPLMPQQPEVSLEVKEEKTNKAILNMQFRSIAGYNKNRKEKRHPSKIYKALQFMNLNRGKIRERQVDEIYKVLKKLEDANSTSTRPTTLTQETINQAIESVNKIKEDIVKIEGKNTKSELKKLCELMVIDLGKLKIEARLVSEVTLHQQPGKKGP